MEESEKTVLLPPEVEQILAYLKEAAPGNAAESSQDGDTWLVRFPVVEGADYGFELCISNTDGHRLRVRSAQDETRQVCEFPVEAGPADPGAWTKFLKRIVGQSTRIVRWKGLIRGGYVLESLDGGAWTKLAQVTSVGFDVRAIEGSETDYYSPPLRQE